MNKSRIISISVMLVALIAGALAISWKLKENKTTMQANAELSQQRNSFIPVAVAQVEKKSFSSDFVVNGTFMPSKQVMVISDVNGRITSLKIDDGTFVQKGQVMLAVDNKFIENELKINRLNLQKAEKDLARLSNLINDGGVTQQQYDEAKTGVESLKIGIESLQKRLDDTYVKAPISGTVNNMRIEDGSYLAPGSPVANIVSINPLRIDVFLTEDQVVTVQKGQRVKVTADVARGREFNGVVTFVDVQADMTKRFPVQIEVSNTGPTPIKAGMNGKAQFSATAPVAALAIPRSAFVGSVLDGKVYVVEKNTARLRQVRAGESYGDYVEVLEGLSAGETVVRSGQSGLSDGVEVKVVSR